MKKTPFILLKITLFLLTAIFFIGHNYAQAEEIPVRERLISVDKQDQDFVQALESIADQAGINLNIHGQIPEGKRDLSMDQMPLGKAMAQVLRMYGVRNHAAAYNPETGTVMLAILETSTHVAALSPEAEPTIDFWDKPLTEDQLARLREQSEIIVAEMEEISKPLTPEQLERLFDKSADIEWEMNEISQPLTPEQLERLRGQSAEIEREMHNNALPLTTEQMQKLRDQSSVIESEMIETTKPVNPEQLMQLKEQSRLIESEASNR